MAFYREMGARLQHQPGVKSVSFARIVPLSGFPMGRELLRSVRRRPRHLFELRWTGLFDAMRIPLFAGATLHGMIRRPQD